MSAAAQLEMFDPDATDSLRLLEGYMRNAERQADAAERFGLLGMAGAVAHAERAGADAIAAAQVMAIYLDLLFEAEDGSE